MHISFGLMPVSAIRPLKIDIIAPHSLFFNESTAIFTCSIVNNAVTFTFIFSLFNSSITCAVDSPLLLVIGIFTYILSAQLDISLPCLIISSKSSANTSKDTGRLFVLFRNSIAKFLYLFDTILPLFINVGLVVYPLT